MDITEKIRTEKDPHLREIYAMGYTHVIYELDRYRLVNKDTGYIKDIDKRTWMIMCVLEITYKNGVMPDGAIHTWISEADGSADKFRELIKPEA